MMHDYDRCRALQTAMVNAARIPELVNDALVILLAMQRNGFDPERLARAIAKLQAATSAPDSLRVELEAQQ